MHKSSMYKNKTDNQSGVHLMEGHRKIKYQEQYKNTTEKRMRSREDNDVS